jgi:hypothetical protein
MGGWGEEKREGGERGRGKVGRRGEEEGGLGQKRAIPWPQVNTNIDVTKWWAVFTDMGVM